MNNPFYVQPGADFGRGLQGLAGSVERFGQSMDVKRQQDKMEQAKAALGEALNSGDPAKVRDVVVQYPEVGQAARDAFGITNETTEGIAKDTYTRVLSDPERAMQYLDIGIQQVANAGGSPLNMVKDYAMFQTDPEAALRRVQMAAPMFGIGGDKSLQFGAQQTFKDEKGNLYFGTQKRDPETGGVASAMSPIGDAPPQPIGKVEMVGAYGLTANEELERRKQQAQNDADIEVDTDLSKLTGKAKEERILKLVDTGIASAETIPTYERMLELVDTVSTGGIQAAIQKAGQLFGWQSADIGELDALFKEAVLANIKKMGANPTEGERTFLLESSGAITQSPAVLKRILTRRLEQAKSSKDKAAKYAKDRGDTEALQLMGVDIVPEGIEEELWNAMTPEERAAFQ